MPVGSARSSRDQPSVGSGEREDVLPTAPGSAPAGGQPSLWFATGCDGVLYRPVPRDKSRPLRHALSVDLEDWQQSVFDHHRSVSMRFVAGTHRILEMLDTFGVRATFFVLGLAAKKAPSLIRSLQRGGHEVQIHGYDHTEVHTQTPERFRQDVLRAKATVEDLIGCEVYGYRAPRFSITAGNLWALDVLAECGLRYDSSIFPLRIRGYGIDGWPPFEHRLRTRAGSELIEVPVATVRVLRRVFPLGGGGYLRLLPYPLIRFGVRRLHRRGVSAVLYCHPHEFDPQAFAESSLPVPWRVRLHQGLGRRGFAHKIRELLDEFPFGPICDLLPDDAEGRNGPPPPSRPTGPTL